MTGRIGAHAPWETLTAVREAQGMSKTELARAAGMNLSHLSALERGRTSPRAATVKAIADALGMSVAAIPPPGRYQPPPLTEERVRELITEALAELRGTLVEDAASGVPDAPSGYPVDVPTTAAARDFHTAVARLSAHLQECVALPSPEVDLTELAVDDDFAQLVSDMADGVSGVYLDYGTSVECLDQIGAAVAVLLECTASGEQATSTEQRLAADAMALLRSAVDDPDFLEIQRAVATLSILVACLTNQGRFNPDDWDCAAGDNSRATEGALPELPADWGGWDECAACGAPMPVRDMRLDGDGYPTWDTVQHGCQVYARKLDH